MKKLLLGVAAIVLSSNVSAMGGAGCEGHEAPFLGINIEKGHCCFAYEDADGNDHYIHGPAEITGVSDKNKNYNLAKCQINIPDEFIDLIVDPADPGRIQVETCNIKKGKGHGNKSVGSGGFTISVGAGIVNGNCKANIPD